MNYKHIYNCDINDDKIKLSININKTKDDIIDLITRTRYDNGNGFIEIKLITDTEILDVSKQKEINRLMYSELETIKKEIDKKLKIIENKKRFLKLKMSEIYLDIVFERNWYKK